MKETKTGTSFRDGIRRSKRELLFFMKNYIGNNDDVKKVSNHKKHALTYANRFSITEDDQYEISKMIEMNCDESEV